MRNSGRAPRKMDSLNRLPLDYDNRVVYDVYIIFVLLCLLLSVFGHPIPILPAVKYTDFLYIVDI